MAPRVVKAEVASISPAAFAARRDFVALSSLAINGTATVSVEALRLLAEGSGNADALSWLLVCLDANPAGWAQVAAWPQRVRVHPPNHMRVRRLVADAAATPQDVRAQSLSALLLVVQPTQVQHDLARSVLRANGQDHAMHEAARLVLAGATDENDRRSLLKDARRAPLPERLIRLNRLLPTTRNAEARAMREALTELASQAVNLAPTHVDAVQRLAAGAADRWLHDWLIGPWAHEPARTAIINPGLGSLLGGPRLRSLIRATTPAGLVPLLAEAAQNLERDEGSMVVAAAYAVGFAVPDSLTRFLTPEVLPEAWDIASACSDLTVSLAIGQCLASGGLTVGARRLAGNDRALALVAAAASAWGMTGPTVDTQSRRIPPAGWTEDVLRSAELLGDGLLAELASSPGPGFAYPGDVIDAALGSEAPIAAFASADQTPLLLEHVQDRTRSADQAVALLRWLPDVDDTQQESLLGVVGWTDAARWRMAVRRCGTRVLARQVKRQTESFDGPQAERVNDSVLLTTVQAALSAGVADELGPSTVPVLSRLLDSDSDDVVTLACDWAALLPVTTERHELVTAVIHADDQRAHRHPGLTALRALLADRLTEAALDEARPDEERSDHLRLAATANPSTARAAALTITHPALDGLRLVAAEVLVETPGSPADEAAIEALLADAKKQPLWERLSQARNALSAPDLVSGLVSLASQLELSVSHDEVIAGRLDRYPDHQDAMLQLVNDVRGSLGPASQVKDFVNNAISLSDKLVDLAVVAQHDHYPSFFSAAAVSAIRGNVRGRLEAGALVVNQKVLETIPWVSHVASLRQSRAAHPSRVGTNAPLVFTETDRIAARQQLGLILTGWLGTMRDTV